MKAIAGTGVSCRNIAAVKDNRLNKRSQPTSLIFCDTEHACRYDTMALKSLDIISVHGFPVGLLQCESNLVGITNDTGRNVGSGG